jgi:hypothetical protein
MNVNGQQSNTAAANDSDEMKKIEQTFRASTASKRRLRQ